MATDSGRRVAPITVISPVRRLWSLWLRLSWPVADASRIVKRPLLKLGFIHAAHWGLVDRLAVAGGWWRLPTPYVVFQSNFDGPAKEYAEAFAITVPWRIRALWGGAYGFPGPRPANRFVAYVLDHRLRGTPHYYARYPEGTVRTVRAALELRESFERLRRECAGLEAEELAAAWRRFLTREQGNL
jgi:hypothetical protein